MKASSKKQILCRLPFIAENTTSVPQLLVKLLAIGVIDLRERDNILSHPSDYDKCVNLCSTILNGKDEHFIFLLNALKETGNEHVADAIWEPLSEKEDQQSTDECFFKLNMVMKGSEAERKLNFYQTLEKQDYLIFQHIGLPGKMPKKKKPVFYSYYVLNADKERLFCLTWGKDKGFVGRLMKNLVGDTIIAPFNILTKNSISVCNEFMGSIKMGDCQWFNITKFTILNAVNKEVYRVKLRGGEATNPDATWDIYEFLHSKTDKVATFGHINFKKSIGEDHGLIYHTRDLNIETKALILGAAVCIMDRAKLGTKLMTIWRLSKYPLFTTIALIVTTVIILLLTTNA